MGKSRWKGLPARASRAALAAVLVAGLTPWGSGVALADEPSDASPGVSTQTAEGTVFYGNAWSSYLSDDDGYPLYDENGERLQGYLRASVAKVANVGDTLYVPGTIDVVQTAYDGSESVISGVQPQDLDLNYGGQGDPSLGKIKHLVIEDASHLSTLGVYNLPSLESVEIRGGGKNMSVRVSSCDRLASVKADQGRVADLTVYACSSLNLEGVDPGISGGLKSLIWSSYPGELRFDGEHYPNLESVSFPSSNLVSYSLLPCGSLTSVGFVNCGLTDVDMDAIPATVKSFNCSNNRIVDTSAIVKRFGPDSARNQFEEYSEEPPFGLNAVDSDIANGYILAGSTSYIDLTESFLPDMSMRSYNNEDVAARNALSNYSVECDDPSVLSPALLNVSDSGEHGAYLALQGKSRGVAQLRVRYHFEGLYGTYDATQEVSVVVSGETNPISMIDGIDAISANAVTDCAICKAAGVEHQERLTKLADVLAVPADPSKSFTQDQELRIESSDEAIAYASLKRKSSDPHSDVMIKVGKPGDATIKVAAYQNGRPTGVEKEIAIHVSEQIDPVLDVADSASLSYPSITTSALGNTDYSFARYENNGAIEALARTHDNVNYASDSSRNPAVEYAWATSDNADAVFIDKNAGLGATTYSVKGAGTANVTVEDIWGNKGTCKVQVKSKKDVSSALHMTQKEITVAKGQQIDLDQYIGGRDALSAAELDRLKPLAFTSDDRHIAEFKADADWHGMVLQASTMRANNVGDVVVKLCYPDGYLNADSYYNNTWAPVEIDTMTVHIVEPTQKEVAVPSPQHLTYNGSEQVAIADTDCYTVISGKATDAGDYVAKLSLKDKDGSVWASTGTSDDIEVKWSIAPAPMDSVDVSVADGPYAYTGKAIEPDVKCSFNGKALEKGKDFDLAFSGNVNVGQAKVTVTGKGNFSGSVERTFSIEKNASGWVGSSKGWWYDNGDGTYPANCWQEIGGATYRFDASGYMRTGWASVDGGWYWLGSSSDGKMATGWKSIGGSWYWFANDGKMATGWADIDGSRYLFNGCGAMLTGWQSVGGTWYYLAGSGKMATGWQAIGGAWYLFDGSGRMATGWQQVGGSWYLFNGSGAMLTGWQAVGGTWYWFAGSGAMATGWQQIGSSWYWFDASGRMANGWFKVGGTYYYANGSGAMQSSRWVGNYYLTGSGAMLTNGFTPDGYYVGPDGAWQYIYWTPGGSAYHKTKDCPSLSRSTNIISGTLAGAGNRTACKNCWH